MDENVTSSDPRCVDEVIALGQVLRQVLLGGVRSTDDEVFLFLKNCNFFNSRGKLLILLEIVVDKFCDFIVWLHE